MAEVNLSFKFGVNRRLAFQRMSCLPLISLYPIWLKSLYLSASFLYSISCYPAWNSNTDFSHFVNQHLFISDKWLFRRKSPALTFSFLAKLQSFSLQNKCLDCALAFNKSGKAFVQFFQKCFYCILSTKTVPTFKCEHFVFLS